MDDSKKSKVSGENKNIDVKPETDESLQAELKELIDFNEAQTGALKKMMQSLDEIKDTDEQHEND